MVQEAYPSFTFHATYRNLRFFFFCGYALWIVLWFVPAIGIRVDELANLGGQERSFSLFDFTRLLFQIGKSGWALFLVLCFCSTLTLAILAIGFRKRWVFLVGACYAVLVFVLGLFMSPLQPPEGTRSYFLPQLLNYVATAMVLSGFWIRPPVGNTTNIKEPL